jgi:hypothetical protein
MLLIGYADQLVRMAIIRVYKATCQYCGQEYGESFLAVDHIDPRSKGGKDDLNNYTLACSNCNNQKSGFDLEKPGRSFLLTLAKKKKPRIERLLQQSLANAQKSKTKPLALADTPPSYGEIEAGDYQICYPLPVNQHSALVFQAIVNHADLKKINENARLRLQGDDFHQFLSAHNLTDDQFQDAVDWLTGLTIAKPCYMGNLVNSFERCYRGDVLDAVSIKLSDKADKLAWYIAQL